MILSELNMELLRSLFSGEGGDMCKNNFFLRGKLQNGIQNFINRNNI